MNIYSTLQKIQTELKAPKDKNNNFGNYKYRSCESILEAAKPVLAKYEAAVTLTDTIELIGDRYYIKADAILVCGDETVIVSAYAREPLSKKGMDEPQVTGTASSYARKYALNGLFAIDDTKDADTDEYHKQTNVDAPKSKVFEETPKKLPFKEWIKDDQMYADAMATNVIYNEEVMSIAQFLSKHKKEVDKLLEVMPEVEAKIEYIKLKSEEWKKL